MRSVAIFVFLLLLSVACSVSTVNAQCGSCPTSSVATDAATACSYDLQTLITNLAQENEGCTLGVYTDTTGHATIGYGFNLDESAASSVLQQAGITGVTVQDLINGSCITADQATAILSVELGMAQNCAQNNFSNWGSLPVTAQAVAIDMSFNLGCGGFAGFVNTIAAINAQNWSGAVSGMQNSLWCSQVGTRCTRDSALMADSASCGGGSSSSSGSATDSEDSSTPATGGSTTDSEDSGSTTDSEDSGAATDSEDSSSSGTTTDSEEGSSSSGTTTDSEDAGAATDSEDSSSSGAATDSEDSSSSGSTTDSEDSGAATDSEDSGSTTDSEDAGTDAETSSYADVSGPSSAKNNNNNGGVSTATIVLATVFSVVGACVLAAGIALAVLAIRRRRAAAAAAASSSVVQTGSDEYSAHYSRVA